MRDWDAELHDILSESFFDDVKPVKRQSTSSDRLVNSFIEVLNFVKAEGREPSENAETLEELKLFRTLRSIRADATKRRICQGVDTIGLLSEANLPQVIEESSIIESVPVESIAPAEETDLHDELEDILNDPMFDDVTAEGSGLFDIPEYMQKKMQERAESESIAKRTECKDFADFEEGFQVIHKKLDDGRCRLVRFKEAHLVEGRYFVVGNMLIYLAHLNKHAQRRDSRGRADDRTRCIFENGTENNVYQQTLVKSLYTEGYTVVDYSDVEPDYLVKHFTPGENDVISGWIYILRSLSTDPEIAGIKDLYKIGFTRQTVEQRTADAENESTYLFAKVQILKTYQVANIKASTFENLIHKLFDAVQLQVNAGIAKPKEWYIVPFPIIDQAIHYIIEGKQVAYDYNIQEIILL
ncbi:MAG: GIY-YIG nuclease family protein [Bacteroidales bacterium]|nr:GIY-YIG nuclease family protein [Bacteroidales bacterium]